MGKLSERPLTKRQTTILKECLLSEKERILNSVTEKTKQFSFGSGETKDSVDEANENIILSQTTRFSNRENLYLKKIFKSLTKIQEGTYGECEDCGANIGYVRLQARLTSDLCITCKEESEQVEKQSIFGKKSKSLGKSLTVSGI